MADIPVLTEPKIFQGEMSGKGEGLALRNGVVQIFTQSSPLKDTGNEDAAVVIPQGPDSVILAVADGVGGHAAGSKASRLVLETLQKNLKEAISFEDRREAILSTIEQANEAIIALGIGAATTLSLMEIQGMEAQNYHVGDSLTLVVGQKGKLKFQTIPHSPVGYAMEAGFIDEEEALGHEERHLVSNVLGTKEMGIEIGPKIKLSGNDTILICSDGLYDNLRTQEICQIIRKGKIETASQNLQEVVNGRMRNPDPSHPSKPDDLTFMLFRLKK